MRAIPLLIGWSLLGLLLGCQAGPKRGVAQVTLSPAYHPDSLGAVAFLGVARGSAAGESAQRAMEALIEEHLMAARAPFAILPRDEVERRVAAAGGRETLAAVLAYWRNDKKVDKFELMKLGGMIGAEGVFLALVDEWSQDAASGGEGLAANTRVSASLSLYSTVSGRRIWRADAAETMSSTALLKDDLVGSEQNTARAREIERRAPGAHSGDAGPAAVGFEAVGRVVAGALARALEPPR
ncbi:MAG: hypothetical protein FJY75_09100 [Candidatus Eisenbacteria bacterium]|uniref:Lipoprotein n=1 Tax=Eiseniibacteriota bacterium TaxID=2212470 RepID=A0A937XCL7_UNCEI|nr:hypothetical protein [Candidatus Eisenbacteria bacterium]